MTDRGARRRAGAKTNSVRCRTVAASLGVLFLLGGAGCARPVPPAGGPEDLVPPRMLASVPESGAVGVSPRQPLRLRFSEWIDPATARAAVVLIPVGARTPELRVDGAELLVIPKEPLDSPATYVLRLQPGLADWHKAATRETREIPFSTGSRIDAGRFSARVWTGSDSAAPDIGKFRVGAWPLDSLQRAGLAKLLRRKDSANWLKEPPLPWREKPWRWAWTDSAGFADLRYLPPARWRLFAWDDRDKDNFWRPGSEPGAWIGDVDGSATDWSAERLVRLGSMDTLGAPVAARDTTKDSLVRKDSLALDSVETRWAKLPPDSTGSATLALDSLPAAWKGAKLRIRVWPVFRRARARVADAAPAPLLRLAPGRWKGEVWQDLDGDGKVGVGDLPRRRAPEPWCALPTFEVAAGDSLRLAPDCRIRLPALDTLPAKRVQP